ncbi:hypothetical protein [Phytohabitans kaempferiae]|uniref:Uncharacterized protein n=1 Tax=Phytohabitans kaempferiae TaxID=1620943 RepID=A0ABV6LYB9_9ACTN
MTNEYRYLIGYISPSNGGIRYGAIDVGRTEPILSADDVRHVQRDLREHLRDPNVVVMSFSLYADPASPDGR